MRPSDHRHKKNKSLVLLSMQTFMLIGLFFLAFKVHADATKDLMRLQKAYPEFIQSVSDKEIIWRDGTIMQADDDIPNKTPQEKLDTPSLLEQVNGPNYTLGIPEDTTNFSPSDDPGRIRYTPFFQQMYGQTEADVKSKLVTIYWMPKFFSDTYPLQVTTVNGVDQKLLTVSNELELLVAEHPEYLPYLSSPGGTFDWRVIANTNRLSMHSFGMTIDINAFLSNYWQWDLLKEGRPISEDEPLIYRNSVPWEIIPIFERQGFIWGGKWHHYDSMHFEYRPELLVNG